MYYKNKKAFSIVEILVAISIIVILSAIAITYSSNKEITTQNTKIKTDISTIETSFEKYFADKQSYPMPDGNKKFYDNQTSYVHSYEDSNTFWVSGFITDLNLPKEYISYLPIDPKTNQYYWYAKLKSDKWFQIASVIQDKYGNYESIVKWNYKWDGGMYDLVREYAWPNLISNKSKTYFAYNPAQRVLVWKIIDFSGSVSINWDSNDLFKKTLREWTKILVSTWWYAKVYLSDGSELYIWDNSKQTDLTLSKMQFKKENNKFTSIKIALNLWTIFSKAPNLDDDSDFEIYTQDAVAAVRWTVFWLSRDNNSNSWTSIALIEWKIEVKKIKDRYEKWEYEFKNLDYFNEIPWVMSWSWIIEVNKLEQEKWISINNPSCKTNCKSWINSNTWALNNISKDIKQEVIENFPKTIKNIELPNPQINTNSWMIYFFEEGDEAKKQLLKTIKNAKKLVLTSYTWAQYELQNNWRDKNNLEINGNTTFNDESKYTDINENNFSIQFCSESDCSKEIKLSAWVDINKTDTDYSIFTSWYDTLLEADYDNFDINSYWGSGSIWTTNWYNLSWTWNFTDSFKKKFPFQSFDLPSFSWKSINSCKPVLIWNVLENDKCSDTWQIINTWWLYYDYKNKIALYNTWLINYKWMFLDNNSNNDYLKYKLDNNTFSWKYIIELWVRGADLQRLWSINYNLFNLTWGSSTKYLKLWTFGLINNLYTQFSFPFPFPFPSSISIWTLTTLNSDNFYRVLVKSNWDSWELAIFNYDWKYMTGALINWSMNFNDNTIYVWSDAFNKNQWNWIIDYFKIWK